MGVPRGHKTHGGTRRRRSHHALRPAHVAKCANCGANVLPHVTCSVCGYYKGRQAFKPKVKKKKVKK